jgi:5'-nucleotidase
MNMVVPHDATVETPIRITRQSKLRYFSPYSKRIGGWEEGGELAASIHVTGNDVEPGTDLHAMLKEKAVSVTPLSLNMTARVSLADMEKEFINMLPKFN